MSTHQTTETSGEYIPETYIPVAESHGTKELLKTFWILLGITLVDFIIYFSWPHSLPMMARNITFIILGVIKAYFIIGTFMHLKYERSFLIKMLIIPAIVLLGMLIFVFLHEGNALSTY